MTTVAITLLPSGTRGMHITRQSLLPAILVEGLTPRVPEDCPDIAAIFCFRDQDAMVDGVVNWLGERFPEDEALVSLELDLSGLAAVATCEWELAVTAPVPPSRILTWSVI